MHFVIPSDDDAGDQYIESGKGGFATGPRACRRKLPRHWRRPIKREAAGSAHSNAGTQESSRSSPDCS